MAVIRALSEADLPAVYTVLEQVAGSAYAGTCANLCDILAATQSGEGATVITVGHDGMLLGVASLLVPEPRRAELVLLWVAPTHRRRGLARAMLAAFTPVWADSVIVAEIPDQAELEPVDAVLSQFAFTQLAGATRTWRTRRVRRTTGRSSLAPVRSSS